MTTAGTPKTSLPAWACAWLGVSLSSLAAFELEVPRHRGSMGPRAWLHADSLLLAIALALVCVAITDALRRWVPRISFRVGAVLLLGALVGVLLIEEDMRGLAESLPGSGLPWSALLGAIAGAGAASGYFVGHLLARRTVGGAIAIVMGLIVAFAHHHVLESGYEGLHLAAIVGCASLVAAALGRLPRFVALYPTGSRATVIAGLLAVTGAAGVAIDPGSNVVLLARSLPGHVLPTLAARARKSIRPTTFASTADSRWLRRNDDPPPTPPTEPALVEDDAIVILLAVDTLRADVIEGPKGNRFPNFKRLAEASLLFTHARSTAPHTTPAIASLMTGKYYSELVWSYRDKKRPRPYTDESPTLGDALQKAGWDATGVVCLRQLSDADQKLTRGLEAPVFFKPAKNVIGGIRKRIGKQPKNKGLFIYAHVCEPHAPYEAKGKNSYAKYLGEIAKVDKALGPLLDDVLGDGPLSKRVSLILIADHGEAFGEHGTKQHGATVYDELMRIPMYVHIPGARVGKSDAAVSLIDLGPTILDLAQAPTPGTFRGQTLLPIVRGEATSLERPLIFESGRLMRGYIEDGRWKFIHDVRRGTYELYDLEKNPEETDNLFDAEPGRAARMAGFTEKFFEVHGHRAPGYEVPYIP